MSERCPTCGSESWWVYISPCDGGIHDGWHAPERHEGRHVSPGWATTTSPDAAPPPAPDDDAVGSLCAIAKRVYLALGGEPENVETGNDLYQTVKRAVFAGQYAPADDAVARARERDAMERVIREAASVGLGIADRNSDAFNAALQRMGEALVALAAERAAKGG